ncbi:putative two-component hybrid sensor and regulator [Megalodesulfovibrio gigas DSM 1382 = ATCC 19364]|uniref:histidine kinase n=1 Tax=Megalodesulfovibrio gigas (strain ATCC 19364 / DSM 1382 / NCIMB 9332 / VKM B-1759) TaxID=1121448 RepID=T2GCN8_MEGG1|nr:putative two-component hybrid sensor and regulator [Megalodesulfovibrio gigas DSM 1382 = ATCC 19364]AGW13662.1 putative two-component hybrid sensor and regulator [Megalodesulfovibrio gigas DSM 1382 = ATCC 19364]
MPERVLIVDDEAPIREVLELSVADLGYAVQTAAHGEAALAACETFGPGIVLTDIKMPGMDGIELLKRIKAAWPDIEVIMVSGHGDMELAIKSLQLEAMDFITKPVRDELLVNALKRASEKIAMRRQLREHTQNLERIVKEKSARLVELERQLAVGQVVEGLSTAMRSLAAAFEEGPSYFNELPCFISIHNRYLEIVAANQLCKTRLGDLVGHHSWEAYADRAGSGNACPVWQTIETGKAQRSRERLRDKDGQEIPVIVHTAPILNQDGQVELVVELSVDVSEVNRLQEELRAAREKWQRLFDAVPATIAVVDREFRIVDANRRFRQDFGETRGGEACRCHDLFGHRDHPCEACPVAETFEDGLSHESETVVATRSGAQRHVLIQTAPVRNEAGEIDQVMEIATDITQIRQLQDHLASLGLMLGSMSHGVKGLLTSLDGGVYKVEAGLRRENDAKVREGWGIVRDKIARIRKMVLDILYYAKSREPERVRVDAAAFARDLAEVAGAKAASRGVQCIVDIAPGAGQIAMDETAMHSALVNFLENAVDACAEAAHQQQVPPAEKAVRLHVADVDGQLAFEIVDNGVGMDQHTREKMFTLFFSSKGSRGTGLGLFISNQIVAQHGGRILVESEPDHGSRIVITLPRGGSAGERA